MSIFVWNGSCCPIQNHTLKKQNAMKLKFTHFPIIKNTIKRIAFKNAYESSIIFQSFLYTSIPAESTSYAPTIFSFVSFRIEHVLSVSLNDRFFEKLNFSKLKLKWSKFLSFTTGTVERWFCSLNLSLSGVFCVEVATARYGTTSRRCIARKSSNCRWFNTILQSFVSYVNV